MLSTLALLFGTGSYAAAFISTQSYNWSHVLIGGGGGYVPGIVFNQKQKGVAYARTDIGGAYRLNADDSWTPILDWVNDTNWNQMGVDALASDPVNSNNVYIAAGLYTISWDPMNGHILKSTDMGNTWTTHALPFKVGGNMPGRGMGERLVVDPNNNQVLFFGTRSGNGLWRSADAGVTWSNVTSFPSVGTYRQDPTDSSGYGADLMGIAWVTFDPTSSTAAGSSRIFVGVANMGATNIFVSEDAGKTWTGLQGQNSTFIPHHGMFSPSEKALYFPYCNGIGPYDGTDGYVMKYFIQNESWVDITPLKGGGFGYGALALDIQKPGTVMVATLNEWAPDANLYRSLNGGVTWSSLWEEAGSLNRHYSWDVSRAPWITTFTGSDTKLVGWMIDGLAIDPFDSNHMLYGTGLTIFGTRDLTDWDTSPRKNITLSSLAVGVEETVPLGLIAPPTGPLLVSVVGDVGGFVHTSLTAPPKEFTNPVWSGTVSGIDYAGLKPGTFVRLSQISASATVSVAISTNAGTSWTPYAGAPAASANIYGGKIAISASGSSLVWSGATGFSGPQHSIVASSSPFAPVSSLPGSTTVVTADKKNDTVFYAGNGNLVYISTNGGTSFKALSVSLGNSRTINAIAANPFTAGDFYVATDAGVFHSTNYGGTFTALSNTGSSYALSIGVPSKTGGVPTVFVGGAVGGVNALYRTDDNGGSWVQLNDATHGFGNVPDMVLAADLRTYGQVFVGWGGRGIFVGHP